MTAPRSIILVTGLVSLESHLTFRLTLIFFARLVKC